MRAVMQVTATRAVSNDSLAYCSVY